ncbi:MAG: GNAT family N-acetyltransferase [Lachnospiraceae bacterium]|nr:GNAT family N-acetyltransferase [Lachnospiraceae bacterium]
MSNFRLETERLVICEFTLDMVHDVHVNSLDDDNRRFVPDEVFENEEEAKETVEFLMSQYGTPDGPLVYPVLTKDAGVNLGYVQFVPLDENTWEIGYHIAKKYTGNGYATEAVKAFLPIITEAKGVVEVHGICLEENKASICVLEKCGFEPVFRGMGIYQEEEREIFKGIWKTK